MWGDASLWWKIADANGLTGQSAIGEGTRLFIPAGVQRNENNSQTFRPYDPMDVLGATSPTTAPRQTGGDMWDKVLGLVVAIVAVIVGIYAGKWATGAIMKALPTAFVDGAPIAAGVISGAAGGAAGSIASQGVLVAGGVQQIGDTHSLAGRRKFCAAARRECVSPICCGASPASDSQKRG